MFKFIVVLCTLAGTSLAFYNRNAVVKYAKEHWSNPNHECGNYTACTPYSYWGGESCGYGSHGGDDANFVSQCILAGGHDELSGGYPCTGYPCGKEVIGCKDLGDCLALKHGWIRTCGYKQPPPSNIMPGDVLIYHSGSCASTSAHATIIVSTNPITIACHSNKHYGQSYTYMASSMPYYEWLHNPK